MSAPLFLRPAAAATVCLALFSASVSTAETAGPRVIVARAANGSAQQAAQSGAVTSTAERGRLSVTVDRAKVIRLPESTRMVVVGNPAIADVAIQKNGIVVVTGKSYGETNLIALDPAGNMLAESTLTVQATSEAIVTVQRGLERQSYSCTPSCQPSVQLGDATPYYQGTKDQALQHSQFSGQR